MLLDDIVSSKKTEVVNIKKQFQFITLSNLADAFPPARDFKAAIGRAGRVNLIAEMKQASPSAGTIVADYIPEPIAKKYESSGAAALSVLTDGPFFKGLLGHLKVAKQATDLPVLRKDFIIDEIQVFESRLAGADAILVILRILDDEKLKKLLEEAKKVNLAVMAEAHNEAEVERALSAGAEIIGINNRDLDSLKVDFNLSLKMVSKFPELKKKVLVSESGIGSRSQIDELRSAGYNAVLIGEALLKSPDPAKKIKELGL
ncbi:MAG TPA: indole-3-glycerol phosphate synthase TrpC [Candidatus Omnitrophota bacterium]|nr:indole-3-glycerol phosphate synthase TrpC [Candidatus Omnitrophota bacterium]